MKTRAGLLVVSSLMILASGVATAESDPLIEEIVAAVSAARVTGYVQTLQDFQTRHTYAQGNTDAGNWLFDFFANLGVEVERHEFTFSTHTEENIIARIRGSLYPDEIVAIGGHFDSTSDLPYTNAPGADDNGSGVAAVLEAALLFKDYQFERTVEFMCFNAEEQGRRGSHAIALDYLNAGTNLIAVINDDMIGYWPTGWQRDLDVAYEPISEWLADQVIEASDTYVGIPISKKPSGVCTDDHYAFTQLGFSAITNMDCWEAHNGGPESTPHYHRTTDTVSTLNTACMAQAIQVALASLASLAGPTAPTGVEAARVEPARLLYTYPNPVAAGASIAFVAPAGGEAVALRVFDARGGLLREIVRRPFAPGRHRVLWDGLNGDGRAVANGVYFIRLESGPWAETRRLTVAR